MNIKPVYQAKSLNGGWEDISDKCKCSLRESMLGDGCKVCQPRTYIAKIEDALQSAESEIEQLEQELAEAKKDQARYQYVKAMTYDKFGEMSPDPVRFDEQVDAAIEETAAKIIEFLQKAFDKESK